MIERKITPQQVRQNRAVLLFWCAILLLTVPTYVLFRANGLDTGAILLWIGMGLAYTFLAGHIPIRLLQYFDIMLYTGSVVCLVLCAIGGPQIIPWLSVNPDLLVPMLFPFMAKMIARQDNTLKELLMIAAVVFVPIFLLYRNTSPGGMLLLVSVLALMLVKARREKRLRTHIILPLVVVLGMICALILFTIHTDPEAVNRLQAFSEGTAESTVTESILHAHEILTNAPMFSGYGSSPEVNGLFVGEKGWELIVLLDRYGWGMGLLLLIGQGMLLIASFRLSHHIKNAYARFVCHAIAVYFLMRFFLSLGSTTNILPSLPSTFALFSTPGTQLLIEYLLIGLMWGLFRQKKKIPQKEPDGDYDTTGHLLRTLREEIEKECKTADKEAQTTGFLQKALEEITRDTQNYQSELISKTEISRKLGTYNAMMPTAKSEKKELVFLSYNQRDRAYAELLAKVIESRGYRCWYFQRDCKDGVYAGQIVRAIRRTAVFVVVVSPNSNDSDHVLNEVCLAFGQKQLGTHLMPVKIKEMEFSDNLNYYLCTTNWSTACTKEALHGFGEQVAQKMAALRKEAPRTTENRL